MRVGSNDGARRARLARHVQRNPVGASPRTLDRSSTGAPFSAEAEGPVRRLVFDSGDDLGARRVARAGGRPWCPDAQRIAIGAVIVDGHDVSSIHSRRARVRTVEVDLSPSSVPATTRRGRCVRRLEGLRAGRRPHYVPWVDAGRDPAKPNRAEKREDALRFAVEYDRLDAAVGQPVTCTVTAERIGHRGYGMLVAEIGLPPGNDVDRSSLDRAVANSGWTVCKYDVSAGSGGRVPVAEGWRCDVFIRVHDALRDRGNGGAVVGVRLLQP